MVEVTQGGINNNYVALAPNIGFFPADAIGPADEGDGSGAQVAVRFAGTGEEVLTDIAGGHRTFRRRGPWGRFFAHHGLGPGDKVIIERQSPYAYHVRPADQLARQPLPGEPGREWNPAQVPAIVADYLAMLAAEAGGRDYSKAEHRSGLLGRLAPGRTPQAVEYKHANISAVMIELGLPYIRGYKPRGNYQAPLAGEIRRQLQGGQVLAAIRPVGQGSPPPADSLRPGQRPSPKSRKRTGRHVDYGLLQEENRRLGAFGEQLAFEFEQWRLRGIGRDDLAARVRWAARDDGDGLGYDVLSFDDAGRVRHIEVKTTGLGALTPFYMSSAEVDFARSHLDSYVLYRIYDATASPRFFALEGDISAAVELVPATYRVQLAASATTTAAPDQMTALPDRDPPGRNLTRTGSGLR